jgi:ATP-dependent DNA ligase
MTDVDADQPTQRAEPFDLAGWIFEAKFDGFRAAVDTAHGRLISHTGNRMKRFEEALDVLPKGHVFDGELGVLDDAGRPSRSCYSAAAGRSTWPLTY